MIRLSITPSRLFKTIHLFSENLGYCFSLQLAENRLNKKYRLPTIHSLVFYSDMPDTVMGMLLHYIDSDGNMADWIDRRSTPRGLREKWYHQIRDTVRDYTGMASFREM